MMDVKDLKVKLVMDNPEAQEVIAELLRGAAAVERLLRELGKALSSDAGQAVIVNALVGHIRELESALYDETLRAAQKSSLALGLHRTLALQFEEGDLAEVLFEQFDQVIKVGSIVRVETTPVQRGLDGQPLWGDGDWAPTTVMCSHPERVGNLEIALGDLRLVKKGGA